MKKFLTIVGLAAVSLAGARGQMLITEWMYQGGSGEYIEFTNVGATSIDMTGWSFSDSGTPAGTVDLSAFGLVLPGQSVILTDVADSAFRTSWSLSGSVAVIGGNTTNLSRGDTINLWNASDTLADTLVYGDNVVGVGGPRTQNASGIATPSVWGTNVAANWFLATAGDAYGSTTSAQGDIGSPGFIPVPEPSAGILLGGALALFGLKRRKRA